MADPPTQHRVSMITVIYGGADVIGACIRSAQVSAERAGVALEVIIIDNKAGDGTAEAARIVAPDATFIENAGNVGFARACNQGFEVATGQWWLLLNPDATLDIDALATLVGFADSHPRLAAVGPMVEGAGTDRAESAGMAPGLRAAAGHFLFISRFLRGDRGGPWRGIQVQRHPELGPRRLDWASAGALLVRPEAIREIGGFDESFFLYAEDVDLGMRLKAAGWQTWIEPAATAAHTVAASSGGVTDLWFVALHHLYARRASRLQLLLFDIIALVGLSIRALLARSDRLHRRRMIVAAQAAWRLALRPRSTARG